GALATYGTKRKRAPEGGLDHQHHRRRGDGAVSRYGPFAFFAACFFSRVVLSSPRTLYPTTAERDTYIKIHTTRTNHSTRCTVQGTQIFTGLYRASAKRSETVSSE